MNTIRRTNSINAVILLIFGLAGLWLCAVPADADPISGHGPIPDMTLKINGSAKTQNVSSYFRTASGEDASWWIDSVTSNDTSVATATYSGKVVTVSPVAVGSTTIQVTAKASGNNTLTLGMKVRVRPDNSPPDFDSSATQSVAENSTTVVTVQASDYDSQDSVTGYSISGGDDSGKFSIDSSSGALTFKPAPDFENPGSSATPKSNTYKVTVKAKSGTGAREKEATQDITVTVTNVNEAPTVAKTIPAVTISVDGTAGSVDVSDKFSDPDAGDTLTYTASSSKVSVATVSVASSTVTVTPVAAGSATITVTATDAGSLSASQTFSVTVKANTAPKFTTSASWNVAENTKTVTTVKASDDESEDTIGDFSISGGDDEDAFSITTGGALTFDVAPNFEDPGSDDDSNVYEVIVKVKSGTGDREKEATQTITVTVTDVNEKPKAKGTISAVTISVDGNKGSVDVSSKFEDPDDDTLTYTASSSKATVATATVSSSTVSITAVAAGTATITVTASDSSLSATQDISVTVKANTAPTFTSLASFNVAENTKTVTTVTASDDETEDTIGDFSIKTDTGSGADHGKFSITTGGALTFSSAPDFETPDSAANPKSNVYKVTVEVESGTGDRKKKATQDITVTVTDVNETPVAVGTISAVTISVDGNDGSVDVSSKFSDPDSDTLTYTASSSKATVATAEVSGSTVTIKPKAAGTATITVTASDGSLSATQTISVTVKANTAPTFTSSASFNVAENTKTVTTVTASDDETEDTIGDFSIKTDTGSGADHGKFSITTGGALTFSSAPDYETPDSAANPKSNVYKVTVEVESGTGDRKKKATQDITVTVTDVNETPVAVGTISAVTISVDGNDGSVDVSSNFSDPDANTTLTYTASSSDTAKATTEVSGSTVTIKPKAAGTATITVTATDAGSLSATQDISVTVKANTAPTFSSLASFNVAENTKTVTTVTASDSETEDTIGDFSIKTDTGSGADHGKFSITTGGALTFSSAPNFESPGSSKSTNVYKVTVEAQSGTGDRNKKATQDITVTVTDVNETPVAVGTISAVTLNEQGDSDSVDVSGKFSDPDGDTLTYTASSSDTAKATVGVSGSTVTITPKADGSATITVTATDGGNLSATQDISVTVTDNTSPTFGSAATASVAENTTTVITVTAGDSDSGDNVTGYSISGGADSGKFSIVASTGVLSFSSAPDFEDPDSDADSNVYKVTVQASSGTGDRVRTATQDITVTVTDVNETPVAVGTISAVTLNEQGDTDSVDVSSNFSDPDGDTLTYTASSSKESVATVSVSSSTVTITPKADGSATITVTATDPDGLKVTQTISVTVTDNTSPTFSSKASVNAAENQTTVITVTANDSDSGDNVTGYSISGGADSGKFSIVASTGVLSFSSAPDFESPGSAAGTNVYTVTVQASSGANDRVRTATQTLTVTVTDVNEAPEAVGAISGVSVNEDGNSSSVDVSGDFTDVDGDTLSYTASSSAASVATASVSGSTVTIAPVDAGSATVTVTATDPDNLNATQTIAVTVKPNSAARFNNSSNVNVSENSTPVITISASDGDSEDSVNSYSISGGADSGKFSIGSSSGALSFNTAPDYESPGSSNGSNVYTVTVQASSGSGDRVKSASQNLSVTVTDVNETPYAVGAIPAMTLNEDGNSDSVDASGYFSDPDGDTLSYAASSSAASVATASVSGSTVTVAPVSAGSAIVTVTASDAGNLNAAQTIAVTVLANTAPALGSSANLSVPENTTAVTTLTAIDTDNGDSVTGYSISGGADSGQFSINASSGALSFNTAPNYESPADASGTNDYILEVQVSSGSGDRVKTATQTLTVTVADVNEAPEASGSISSVTLNVDGNSHSVDVSGNFTDPDGDTLTYTASSSAASVATASVSGSSVTIAPVSAGSATVTVTATDPGNLNATQTIAVTVMANTAPAFSSPSSVTVAENTTAVITLTAADSEDSINGYSISGGADSGKFAITSVGVLTFKTAPDFETPGSAAGTNVYRVTVQVSSGSGDRRKTATQTLTVTVTDVNEAPVAGNAISAVSVNEDGDSRLFDVSGNFSDPDGDILTYTVSSGAASVAAASVSGSTITIAPVSAGTATVTVTASDPGGLSAAQTIAVTVKANKTSKFIGVTAFSVPENTTFAGTITATDSDDSINGYSISGGADGGRFSIVASTGALSFYVAPDFESPGSAAGTNVYAVEVSVSSGSGDREKKTAQTITVTVTDVNETPEAVGTISAVTLSVDGDDRDVDVSSKFSDPDGDILTYTVSSGKASVAAVSVSGSTITIAPVSAGTATVTVTASDSGGLTAAQTVAVTVKANTAPTFTSSASVDAAENQTAVVKVKATDSESEDSINGYSISGGADSGKFAITSSGALSFNSAPNYESPGSAAGTNVYKVNVQVESGTGDRKKKAAQDITVTVTDVNEAPEAVGTISAVVVNEDGNSRSVDVSGNFSDPDGDALTYAVSSSKTLVATVSVSSSTVAIAPVAAGSATVTVTASDGSLSAVQTIAVTVKANTAPAFSSSASVNVKENSTIVVTVTASDNDDSINGYTISGGVDSGKFSIIASTGVLSFSVAPDFETPGSAAGTNVYKVNVQVESGTGDRKKTGAQHITVTVTDVNEAPEAVGAIAGVILNEGGNSRSVDVLGNFSDPDGDILTYTVSSGKASVAAVSVSGSTITIAPVSAGTATVTVTASDSGGLTAAQTVAVTVKANNTSRFIGAATFSVPENTTFVGTIQATDSDDSINGYSISGGADGGQFSIVASTGALSFNTAPDYEAPADASGNNNYVIEVQVFSGSGDRAKTATKTLTIAVTDVNETPVAVGTISGVAVSVDGNDRDVDVSSKFSDPDGDALTYTVLSSASLVAAASVSGSTITIAPVAAGTAIVTVTASDGSLSATQTISVTVKANTAPVFTSSASVNVAENSTTVITVTASDNDDSISGYSIIGGADRGKFFIGSLSGVLSFNTAPDYEAPADASRNNDYVVEVQVSSGSGDRIKTARQTLTATVVNVNEAPVAVGKISGVLVNEGGKASSVDVLSKFSDPDGDTLSYTVSLSKGSVATASVSGSIVTVTPVAAGSVRVTVIAADPDGLTATQSINVAVKANSSSRFSGAATFSVPENTTPVGTIKATDSDDSVNGYSISGGADSGKFVIGSSSGALRFNSAPDFESPGSMAGTNVYAVEVSVSSGSGDRGKTTTQSLTVAVTDVNEAPVAVGTISGVIVNEGGNAGSVDVSGYFSDPDNDALIYAVLSSKTSVAAAIVSGSTITITPVAAGTATVTVTASDPGGLSATQTIAVTVRANSGPKFNGAATFTVPENTTPVGTIKATDSDDSINGYSISGGADSGQFSIGSSSGALSFNSAPNYESPGSAAGTNVYTVEVQVFSGNGDRAKTARQTFTVAVTDVNEAPAAVGTISGVTLSVDGNDGSVDVSSKFSDPDGDTLSFTASSSAGNVAAASVSGSTVTIAPVAAGSATITVTASDGSLTATQTIAVIVQSASNQAPVVAKQIASVTLTDGSSTTVDVSDNFSDPNGDGLTYTVTSSDTGVVTVSVSGDSIIITAAGEGTATITVTATDSDGLTVTQTFTVTVEPAPNSSPVVKSSIESVTLTDGSSTTVDVSDNFSDPDRDDLTYTAVSSDTGVATVSVSGDSIIITAAGEGTATITVTATDSDGLTTTETFTVKVEPAPNSSPVVKTSIKPVTLTDGSSTTVDVSDNFSDPDGDSLTYTVVSSDTGVATVSVSGDSIIITAAGEGTATVTVTATDSRGLTVTTDFNVTIVQLKTVRYRTELLPNYPNPFNPDTWIPYRLSESSKVTVTIYDVQGLVVRTLKIGYKEAGDYTERGKAAYWNGRNDFGEIVADGIYFYNFTTSNYSATLQASVIK